MTKLGWKLGRDVDVERVLDDHELPSTEITIYPEEEPEWIEQEIVAMAIAWSIANSKPIDQLVELVRTQPQEDARAHEPTVRWRG